MGRRDVAQRVGACFVADVVAALMIQERLECIEMSDEDLEQWSAFGRVRGEQFGKRQLHFVFADQPCAEFGLCGVSTGDECLFECFAAEESALDGVGERGVA